MTRDDAIAKWESKVNRIPDCNDPKTWGTHPVDGLEAIGLLRFDDSNVAEKLSMSERKYALREIDQMRECLRLICHRDKEDAENQLRTYMLNGTDPEEIANKCFEVMQRIEASRKRILAGNAS